MDLKPDRPWGVSTLKDRYWFYCKTRRRPYDQAVMLAMIALKYRLGEQIELENQGQLGLRLEQTPRVVLARFRRMELIQSGRTL